MSLKTTALIFAVALASCTTTSPDWKTQAVDELNKGELSKAESIIDALPEDVQKENDVKIDSIRQIIARMRNDFSLTPEEGRKKLAERLGEEVDSAKIEEWIAKRYIETMVLDGEQRWFRKSVNNAVLINREDFADYNDEEKAKDYNNVHKYYLEAMASPADSANVRNWHSAQMTFTIDVNADAVPAGDTIRAWLPFPIENGRQRNIKLISSSHNPKFSDGSMHNTIYMEDVAVAGKPAHFEIVFSYEVGAQVFTQDYILKNLKPYNVDSDEYKMFTKSEAPHTLITDSIKALANRIVGDEQNPVKQASMVYDWIVKKFPWAGARDYSTIPNIPEYVLTEGHGDCGQVTLLNMTLLRSLGIPARWESGWMLHPGSKNLHDWGEIYFEGIGWVPCDVSFGRTVCGEEIQDYYKTGTDIYRMATNRGVCGELSPKKKYLRCDAVDFQLGEVEWAGGNLPMSDWDSHLNIDKFEPIKPTK